MKSVGCSLLRLDQRAAPQAPYADAMAGTNTHARARRSPSPPAVTSFGRCHSVMKACHAIASFALLSVAYSLLPAPFALDDHGASIPAVGLGTYLARGPELRKAVQSALDSGLYTHIDTAASECSSVSFVSSPSSSRRRC